MNIPECFYASREFHKNNRRYLAILAVSRHKLIFGIIALLIIVTIPLARADEGAADSGYVERGTSAFVTGIVDGDSIVVRIQGKEVPVRLWGIDAPEFDQSFARESKIFLKELIDKKEVMLIAEDIDKYHRLVATVFLDRENINEIMVAEGFAWVHVYFCNKAPCSYWYELQDNARKRGIGIWLSKKQIAPWVWKKRK